MEKSNYQNRLNFYSIVEACREFLPAIREEYRARWSDLADIRRPDDVHPSASVNFNGVLEGHRVRFVNQERHYDYANIEGDYKSVAITLDLENPDYEQLRKDIIELLLEIHNNPDTRYVLPDMKEAIGNNKVYREIAECFRPAGVFLVSNLVMPFEIALP